MKFLKGSLYLKLLTIYGVTFFLLVSIFTFAVRLSRPMSLEQSIRRNVYNYSQYLARDIGTPPSIKRAKRIQRKTKIDIAIFGPEVEWTNDQKLLKKAKNNPHKRQGRGHVKVHLNGYTFVFGGRNLRQPDLPVEIIIGVLMAFALILAISYRLVKHVMAPLKEMKTAATSFAEGKWQTRVPIHTQDELAELGQTMNHMAEKIEAHFKNMKDLLLAISHELRSPLTRMKVITEFMDDEKIKKSLNEEITSLDRITGMLLERERLSSKPEILEKTQTNLENILTILKQKFPDLQVGPDNSHMVSIDSGRFELALSSIVDNAFKHGKPPVVISTGKENDKVWIEIKDHGEGLTIEEMEKLGDPFFRQSLARTSSRKSEGFGLGLSLAYSILKAHNFKVSVQNVAGTTFRIEMPKA